MREGPGKLFITLMGCFLSLNIWSQAIVVEGGFVEDSLLIGQEVNYWVTSTYPASMELIFPDSNSSFSPFEYASKKYFPSKFKNGLAYDSTVYTLQSFEIDAVQFLSLNTLILDGADSTIIQTPRDSIFLTELAPVVTDSTELKTNLEYQSVNRQFNYPLMYYIIGGLVILTLILLLIFGKRILKYLKLKRLQRDHRVFSEVFTEFVTQLKSDPKPELAEKTLVIWKKYQEKLDRVGFTTLTTKEILSIDFANELEKPLKSIDRTVYGNRIQEDIYQDFQLIEDFTDERFKKKVDEIKHGE